MIKDNNYSTKEFCKKVVNYFNNISPADKKVLSEIKPVGSRGLERKFMKSIVREA